MQIEEQFQMITSMEKASQDMIGLEWGTWSRHVEKYGKILNKPSMSQIIKLLETEVPAGNCVA